MFFARIPSKRGVSSDDFAVLSFDQGQRLWDIVADFMEFKSWEIVLAGTVEKSQLFDRLFGE